jgi:hypothetical protein
LRVAVANDEEKDGDGDVDALIVTDAVIDALL